ncbi:MAG: hypothetical protein WBB29_13190 [Geitlerinemataceae cyanobacterium]
MTIWKKLNAYDFTIDLDRNILKPELKIEAIVVLYYFPINPYLTLRKHMGQDTAEEYLQEIAAFT